MHSKHNLFPFNFLMYHGKPLTHAPMGTKCFFLHRFRLYRTENQSVVVYSSRAFEFLLESHIYYCKICFFI